MRYLYFIATVALIASIPLASAENATQTFNQGQIYNYNIQLDKPQNIGIFDFELNGTYGGHLAFVSSLATQCQVTNIVNCTTLFLINGGNYSSINVLINGAYYETFNMTQNVTVAIPTPQEFVYQKDFNYLWYIVPIIISIFALGNVIYYLKHKNEIP